MDRDAKFGEEVSDAVKAIGLRAVRTTFRSPWQNGVAERWVGSCRRDLLDHVIPLNERHLKCLLSEYIRYYHLDRTHVGLEKHTPTLRPVAQLDCKLAGRVFPPGRGITSPFRLGRLASVDFRLCVLRAWGEVCPKDLPTRSVPYARSLNTASGLRLISKFRLHAPAMCSANGAFPILARHRETYISSTEALTHDARPPEDRWPWHDEQGHNMR